MNIYNLGYCLSSHAEISSPEGLNQLCPTCFHGLLDRLCLQGFQIYTAGARAIGSSIKLPQEYDLDF